MRRTGGRPPGEYEQAWRDGTLGQVPARGPGSRPGRPPEGGGHGRRALPRRAPPAPAGAPPRTPALLRDAPAGHDGCGGRRVSPRRPRDGCHGTPAQVKGASGVAGDNAEASPLTSPGNPRRNAGCPTRRCPTPPGRPGGRSPPTRRGSWTAQLDRCSINKSGKMIRPWFRQAAVPWKTTVTQTRASGENRVSTKLGVLHSGFAGLVFGRSGCWGLSGEFDGDGFEFGDELAQAAVGGEVGAEPFGFLGGEGLGDGAGSGFAGPGGVGAVQDGRAGAAVAAGPLAAGGAAGERAGQGDADPGELGLDLLVAAGRVVHGDRIPYPPRRRHPPLACLNLLYFKHGCPSRGRCGGRGLGHAAGGQGDRPRAARAVPVRWYPGSPGRPGVPGWTTT